MRFAVFNLKTYELNSIKVLVPIARTKSSEGWKVKRLLVSKILSCAQFADFKYLNITYNLAHEIYFFRSFKFNTTTV